VSVTRRERAWHGQSEGDMERASVIVERVSVTTIERV
jgi:hypothetical protein